MNPSRRTRAFTLVELLVVMGIIVLMASLVVPAVTQTLKGSILSEAYPLVMSELARARQMATSKNSAVEVRFYIYDNPPNPNGVTTYNIRAMQTWIGQEDGTLRPLDKVVTWPLGVVISAKPGSTDYKASSIVPMTEDGTGGGLPVHPHGSESAPPALPGLTSMSYKYLSFQFRPDGSTSLLPANSPSSTQAMASTDATNTKLWYFTMHNEHDALVAGAPPANYVTVQIDPYTGDVKTYRP